MNGFMAKSTVFQEQPMPENGLEIAAEKESSKAGVIIPDQQAKELERIGRELIAITNRLHSLQDRLTQVRKSGTGCKS